MDGDAPAGATDKDEEGQRRTPLVALEGILDFLSLGGGRARDGED